MTHVAECIDDTLMASSHLSGLGLCPKFSCRKPCIPEDVHRELQVLEKLVIQILDKALAYGRVIIVTAAESGWVELSASLYMPCVVPYLHTRVKVISARSDFECLYPDSPLRWKIEAFDQEVFPIWETLDPIYLLPKQIVSFGDGPTEREALISLKGKAKIHCHGKSMKLLPAPKLKELCMELEIIISNMDQLCAHEGDLDLQIAWDSLRM